MNEKIRENFEKNDINKERRETSDPLRKVEDEISSSQKEGLLKGIYEKEGLKKENGAGKEDIGSNKNVSILVKEYFSVGVDKTVKKARKILDAFGLDAFHDELTKKNRSDKR